MRRNQRCAVSILGRSIMTSAQSLRASLLATSAIAAIGFAAPAALVLAPTAAMAANECGTDPNANGAAADVVVCPPATYPTGITYTTNGDLTLTLQESAAGAVNSPNNGLVVFENGFDN